MTIPTKPMRVSLSSTGMTLVELLCVIVAVIILGVILWPAPIGKGKNTISACVNNLRQIALAQITWASEHSTESQPTNFPTINAKVPEQLTSHALAFFYRSLSNEIVNPRILACPADKRRPSETFATLDTNSISYFANIDAGLSGNPEAVLNGDRHLQSTPPRRTPFLTLRTNLDLGWDPTLLHKTIGNLSFVDGSVVKSSNREMKDYLGSPRTDGHRLLFP